MSVRELIVLGTSSQVPTRHRNHNGYLLRWDDEGFLFDPGEGTQRQMIYAQVSTSSITQILITHFHGDHCLGLAGICQRISLDRVPHQVRIHYPASGKAYYKRLRRASIYHDVAKIQPCPIDGEGEIYRSDKLAVNTLWLDHTVETFGYRIEEHDRRTMLPDKLKERGVEGPDIGRLLSEGELEIGGDTVRLEEVSIPKPGQSMAFIMDTRICDAAFELAQGVDLLVCESTYLSSEETEAGNNGHMTAAQAATIAQKAGAKKLVLTHFSQRYPSTEPFLREARAIHPDVVAARDGGRVTIPRRKKKK